MNAFAQTSARALSGSKLDNRRVLAALIDLAIVGAGGAAILVAAGVLGGDGGSLGAPLAGVVVGWALSAINDRHLVIRAMEMAVHRRCPEPGLVSHSDQGCTYASGDYRAILEAREITCSMSRRGDCYDNAVMESFFSTVKNELADRFESYGAAKKELFDYLEVFYNQRRRHSTLGQISPAAFERGTASVREGRHRTI